MCLCCLAGGGSVTLSSNIMGHTSSPTVLPWVSVCHGFGHQTVILPHLKFMPRLAYNLVADCYRSTDKRMIMYWKLQQHCIAPNQTAHCTLALILPIPKQPDQLSAHFTTWAGSSPDPKTSCNTDATCFHWSHNLNISETKYNTPTNAAPARTAQVQTGTCPALLAKASISLQEHRAYHYSSISLQASATCR